MNTETIPTLKRNTWLGQEGESGETNSGLGNRVVVHRWLTAGEQGESGEVEVRAIKGDGRRPDFVEHYRESLMNPTDDQIRDAMARARRHFN